jgi:hypothetical protein
VLNSVSGDISTGTNSLTTSNITSTGDFNNGTHDLTTGHIDCSSLTSSGPVKINDTSNYIELNADSKTKEGNAGKIGYDLFTPGLNFVGGGTNSATRSIYCYAEGGFETNGPFISTEIKLPTSGGTSTALNYYEEATQSNTFSGIWASAQSFTIYFTRIGKMVNCTIGTVEATANTASFITLDTVLPTRFRPRTLLYQPVIVTDNGVAITGMMQIGTGGTVYIVTIPGANFTGSGTSGLAGTSLSWQVT